MVRRYFDRGQKPFAIKRDPYSIQEYDRRILKSATDPGFRVSVLSQAGTKSQLKSTRESQARASSTMRNNENPEPGTTLVGGVSQQAGRESRHHLGEPIVATASPDEPVQNVVCDLRYSQQRNQKELQLT